MTLNNLPLLKLSHGEFIVFSLVTALVLMGPYA